MLTGRDPMSIVHSASSARRTVFAMAIAATFAVPAFAAPGDPIAPEFTVSAGGGPGAVARNGAGNTVVVFGPVGLKAQRLDAAGTLLGAPITVTLSFAQRPNVAMDATGHFVVTWQEDTAIKAQRYFASGVPNGATILV